MQQPAQQPGSGESPAGTANPARVLSLVAWAGVVLEGGRAQRGTGPPWVWNSRNRFIIWVTMVWPACGLIEAACAWHGILGGARTLPEPECVAFSGGFGQPAGPGARARIRHRVPEAGGWPNPKPLRVRLRRKLLSGRPTVKSVLCNRRGEACQGLGRGPAGQNAGVGDRVVPGTTHARRTQGKPPPSGGDLPTTHDSRESRTKEPCEDESRAEWLRHW